MTHISEKEFMERVKWWLAYRFSREHVEYHPRVESEYRPGKEYVIPDAVVRTPFGRYVIEVENEGFLTYEAVGQALSYAQELAMIEDQPFGAVVIVPEHEFKQENPLLKEYVTYIQLKVKHERN